MVDHYEIIDQIRKLNQSLAPTQALVSKPEPDRYEILDLTFKPGDTVTDTVSHQKGVVTDARREFIPV